MTDSPEISDSKNTEAKTSPPAWIKLALDFGPLVIFFASFKFGDIFVATGVFMVTMIAAMMISKLVYGEIAGMLKFTACVVMVMGGLTLYLQDETFVKMKPTIVYGVMAAILIFGFFRGRFYMQSVMGAALEMDDAGWRTFTRNTILFLLIMMIGNEVIWRTQTTDTWVSIKTFGYIGATFIFMISQIPLIAKYMPHDEGS